MSNCLVVTCVAQPCAQCAGVKRSSDTLFWVVLVGAIAFALGSAAPPVDQAFIGRAADEPALPGLLGRVTSLHLVTATLAPGGGLTVFTDLRYADAGALAAGRVANRACYAQRDGAGGSLTSVIDLGHQDRDEGPVFADASITPVQATTLNSTPVILAALARRYCRFRG